MSIPSIICGIILVLSFFLPIRFALSVVSAFASFGSLTVLPPELTGGTSFLVGTVAMLVVLLKAIASGGVMEVIKPCFNYKRLGLLTTFTFIAAISAIILPSFFENDVIVFPMRLGALVLPEPLKPTAANFTQSTYLVVSLAVATAYCYFVRQKDFIGDFSVAMIVGGVAVVVTGIMGVAADTFGLTEILASFRTANYGLAIGAEIQGVRRVIGLMPEASSFGGFASFQFSLLLFARNIYPPRIRRRVVMPLILGCAIFAVLSTSSTAYAELLIIFALLILTTLRGILFGAKIEQQRKIQELMALIAIVTFLVFSALIFDGPRESFLRVVDEIVFRKSESLSFIERSSWNTMALNAWLATGGLGVGTGSVRTSNLFINILASTGFLGFGLFACFIVRFFLARPPMQSSQLAILVSAIKLTLFPVFTGAYLAGTTPDYGASIGALFGIVMGSAAIKYRRSWHPSRKTVMPSGHLQYQSRS